MDARHIFPFFDLPRELRNDIYGRWGIAVTFRRERLGVQHTLQAPIVQGACNIKLCLLSRQFNLEYEEELRHRHRTLKIFMSGDEGTWSSGKLSLPPVLPFPRQLADVRILELHAPPTPQALSWSAVSLKNLLLRLRRLKLVRLISHAHDNNLSVASFTRTTQRFLDIIPANVAHEMKLLYTDYQLCPLPSNPLYPVLKDNPRCHTRVTYKVKISSDAHGVQVLDFEEMKPFGPFDAEIKRILGVLEKARGSCGKKDIARTLMRNGITPTAGAIAGVQRWYEMTSQMRDRGRIIDSRSSHGP